MSRKLRGQVVSDKMDKTVVVAVVSSKEHPLYRKKYHVTNRYKAHDQSNACRVGDLVEISETRPRSSQKRWLVERKITAKEASE